MWTGMQGGANLMKSDAKVVLGMDARGDKQHDISAWFGVNPARIAEVKQGAFGNLEMAPAGDLPPRGAPGIKGQRLRNVIRKVIDDVDRGANPSADDIVQALRAASLKYDANDY